MCNNKLELVCSRPNLCVVLHVKQMIWRVKCFILFFIYPRRLYFKSLSSGETDKEKYFLVLQVSFTFIYFFSSVEEFFHIYLFLYGLAVWEGFVIPGFSVSDPDFFKWSGFLTQTSPFLALFLSRKVVLWYMADWRTMRTTRENRGEEGPGISQRCIYGVG